MCSSPSLGLLREVVISDDEHSDHPLSGTHSFLEFLQIVVSLRLLGPLGIALHSAESRYYGRKTSRPIGHHLESPLRVSGASVSAGLV